MDRGEWASTILLAQYTEPRELISLSNYPTCASFSHSPVQALDEGM